MKLQSSKTGCHHYYGCLIFADNIKLLSQSATGLQTMVDVCRIWTGKFYITFNEKKSVCIKFGNDSQKPDILWYLPAMTDTSALLATKQAHKWFNDHEYPSLGLRRGVRTLRRITVENEYTISWG